MKKVAIAATSALALAVGITGVSQAVNADQAIDIKVSPAKKGTKKKPKNVKLFVETITTPKDSTAFGVTQATIWFDKNLTFNGKAFKNCANAQVRDDETKCAKGSKVGSGSAKGVALGQIENLTVTAWNGPGGNKIELHVVGTAPLQIDEVIEGTLQGGTGKYGKKLVVPIPDKLIHVAPGVTATLTDFQTTVKGTGKKKKPYVGLTGCTAKTLNFAGDFTYTDNTSQHAEKTVACS